MFGQYIIQFNNHKTLKALDYWLFSSESTDNVNSPHIEPEMRNCESQQHIIARCEATQRLILWW